MIFVMSQTNRPFTRAALAMLGTIIGAGTFALPEAFHRMGILAGSVAYWITAAAVLVTHLLYVDVILGSPAQSSRRLPGQAKALLGKWGERVAYVSHPAQIIGACLAYLILGGEFLAVLARAGGLPDRVLTWQILFWAGGAATVFVGLKLVARVEAWLTWTLVALLVLSVLLFLPVADPSLFPGADWGAVAGYLGIFLFALFGWAVIPEVAVLCGRDPVRTRLAVAGGTLGAALLMWLFGVFAYAAIGPSLASAPADLSRAYPAAWAWLLPAVGFLAVATSFITLVQDLKAMLHLDAGLPKPAAWALALGGPLFLLLAVSRDFLGTVGFVGAVITGFNGIFLCFLAVKTFRRRGKALPLMWRVAAPLLCSAVFAFVLIRRLLKNGG